MDIDLSSALHDAARSGSSAGTGPAPGTVMQRIRRRRAARRAVEGTVGLAAVGAVALGAVQVTGGWDAAPVQPARPTTTSPPPEPEPVARWSAVVAAEAFRCGAPAPGLLDPEGEADLRFEPVLSATTPAPGEAIAVDPVLVNGTDRALEATAATAPGVWFVQGDTVVGVLRPADGAAPGPTDVRVGAGASATPGPVTGSPTACTPDGTGTDPLPPGEYTVHVEQTIETRDGQSVRLAAGPAAVSLVAPVEPDPGTSAGGEGGAHPDLADLVLTVDGLGPLGIGSSPETGPGAAMVEWDADACDFEGYGGDETGRWVPSGYPRTERDGSEQPAFRLDVADDAVGWIDVVSPAIRTAEGVGIGTTVEDLRAAHPGLEGPFDGPVSRVWWLRGPTANLVFETQDDSQGLQPVGTPEQVILMRVLSGTTDPAFATANSDHVAGGCL